MHHVHLHRGRGIESGFEMAMFFPFKGSEGSEGSKCLYSFESFGFLDRAHKHERARAGLAGGRVERV